MKLNEFANIRGRAARIAADQYETKTQLFGDNQTNQVDTQGQKKAASITEQLGRLGLESQAEVDADDERYSSESEDSEDSHAIGPNGSIYASSESSDIEEDSE